MCAYSTTIPDHTAWCVPFTYVVKMHHVLLTLLPSDRLLLYAVRNTQRWSFFFEAVQQQSTMDVSCAVFISSCTDSHVGMLLNNDGVQWNGAVFNERSHFITFIELALQCGVPCYKSKSEVVSVPPVKLAWLLITLTTSSLHKAGSSNFEIQLPVSKTTARLTDHSDGNI